MLWAERLLGRGELGVRHAAGRLQLRREVRAHHRWHLRRRLAKNMFIFSSKTKSVHCSRRQGVHRRLRQGVRPNSLRPVHHSQFADLRLLQRLRHVRRQDQLQHS